ncbi:hypothetical protein F4553_005696 [Allocatelliglobosispora scoriae]|uniref:Uncharacterized protein n=1 Tax=Allocatelliglobosispora scoriae TaxID=643052 RepID=A0A841BZP3_9ACTN|nr:hypothetical protein [Allocatelliglobosispora scoriae]MBB5872262.1 hypothetical protein [Allocatelliglobosispora scoriae]
MGRIVKQLSDNTTKYYWYPGEKQEWVRAAVAVGSGLVAGTLAMMFLKSAISAVVIGTSLTLAIAGFNFGRRDARALAGFPGMADKAARRAAAAYTGKAAWRGLVMGIGGALAAMLVINLSPIGWINDWLLPVVPAVASALARQLGMVWQQMGHQVKTKGPAAPPAPAQPEKA